MILKALGPHQYYDSDDEYAPDRVPLLKNAPPHYVVDPGYAHGNDTWRRQGRKDWNSLIDHSFLILAILDFLYHLFSLVCFKYLLSCISLILKWFEEASRLVDCTLMYTIIYELENDYVLD